MSTMTIYFNILTQPEKLEYENQGALFPYVLKLVKTLDVLKSLGAFSLNQPFHPASCYSQSQHLHRNTFCVAEIVATASAMLSTREA